MSNTTACYTSKSQTNRSDQTLSGLPLAIIYTNQLKHMILSVDRSCPFLSRYVGDIMMHTSSRKDALGCFFFKRFIITNKHQI